MRGIPADALRLLAWSCSCALVCLGTTATGHAQTPSPPSVTTPGADSLTSAAQPAGEDLDGRIRQLELLLRSSLEASARREALLEQRIHQLESQLGEVQQIAAPTRTGSTSTAATGGSSASGSATAAGGASASPGVVRPGYIPQPSQSSDAIQMPPPAMNVSQRVKFGPGFQLADEDEEFVLQFHNLTQVDGRFYEQGDIDRAQDTFGIPREWFIFNGRLTRPFEYYVAINQGFDNINLLDAFLNIHFDDRVQLKAGRYKTPFTYEFYALPVQGLIQPERSQFFNNYGLNRDVGLMLWGQFFEKRLDYAVGIFNGARNGFLDIDGDSKDVAAFINVQPFLKSDIEAIKHLNFGGSLDAGNQDEPQFPNVLRLNVPTQANPVIGDVFLAYAPGVLESGTRALWSLHAAWYYRQLSLIAEWQSGYENLAFSATPYQRQRVPVGSFYVQSGLFLTGEHVSMRGVVDPLRPFDIRKGKRGPGAWELATRYNMLNVGREIFDGGFADPDLWTNHVQTIDVGVNWYMNRFIKVYLGWQKGLFADPVLYATNPNRFQIDTDLWWFRFQIFF